LDIDHLDFETLPFSQLFLDYLEKSDNLSDFYSFGHSYEELKQAVTSYQMSADHKSAARIMARFNEPFLGGQTVSGLSEILSDDNTVTITTGQQLSLFGGPLYTVFKTISTIHLARVLSRDTGRRVVPVFWLADEDHDFDEIAVVSIPERNSLAKITLPCESCARHAAGSIRVDGSFEPFRSEVYNSLAPTDFHEQITKLLDDSYMSGRSYRESFGILLARLFGKHGLIFAGSNFTDAKQHASGCLRKAVAAAGDIGPALSGQSKRLGDTYHQQVQVTDSLLFWHDDEHGRVRLRHENGRWETDSGLSMPADELLRRLDEDPARFSPNVFLRPLIQDTLLPNAAYVGGPAEIAYYGQMKPLYELFGMKMPYIAARMSATLVEPAVQRSLAELPFDFPDYARRLEDLEQHYLRKHGNPELDGHFESWKSRVDHLTSEMTDTIGIDDPGLQKHALAITREYGKSIDKLKKKMVNVLRQKEQVQVNRIHKVKHALFPDDHLQEREISFIYYMNKFGTDIWDRILGQLEEEDGRLFDRHHIIRL
jgi:bacillithiol synthase